MTHRSYKPVWGPWSTWKLMVPFPSLSKVSKRRSEKCSMSPWGKSSPNFSRRISLKLMILVDCCSPNYFYSTSDYGRPKQASSYAQIRTCHLFSSVQIVVGRGKCVWEWRHFRFEMRSRRNLSTYCGICGSLTIKNDIQTLLMTALGEVSLKAR